MNSSFGIFVAAIFWSWSSHIHAFPSDFSMSYNQKINPETMQLIEELLNQGILEYNPSDGSSDFIFDKDRRVTLTDELTANSGDGYRNGFRELSDLFKIDNEKLKLYLLTLLKLNDQNVEDLQGNNLYWRQKNRPTEQCLKVDGVQKYHCPSPDPQTKEWYCINDHQLCDGMKNCPNNEDEDMKSCMFYHVMKSHVKILANNFEWFSRSLRELSMTVKSLADSDFSK